MSSAAATTADPLPLQQTSTPADRLWLLIASAVFAALSLWFGFRGEGFVEADGCTHYLFSRFAIDHPYLLVNVWGRPLVTAVYALPAYFGGRTGVRLTSLVMAMVCALAVYRIARNQQYRHPSIAAICLFAQPMFFLHSFAELTELVFATVVVLAFWAYQQRMWMVMTVLIAITPVGRPEGFGFMIAAAVALLLHRRWWWILALPLPLVIWSWIGWVQYGSPDHVKWYQWLIHEWPYEAQSNYGSGPIWHYAAYLPAVVGPLLLPATLVGAVWCFRHGRLWDAWPWSPKRSTRLGPGFDVVPGTPTRNALTPSPGTPGEGWGEGSVSTSIDRSLSTKPSPLPADREREQAHRRRCDFVLAALPFGILLVHSIFWFFGKFSGGELRYLMVVAPCWALVTARGVERLATLLRLRHPILIAGLLAIVPLSVNRFYHVLPIDLSPDEQIAKRIAEQYRGHAMLTTEFPRIVTPVPTLFYFLDVCNTDSSKVGWWNREAIQRPQPGLFLIYETVLANYNSDARMVVPKELIEQSGWVLYEQYGPGWAVYLSPVSASGRATHDLLEKR